MPVWMGSTEVCLISAAVATPAGLRNLRGTGEFGMGVSWGPEAARLGRH